ncbi:MAG: SDR family oxidoreductase [Bacteroidetes bacterium]|nr:MAG: SDR family oxidoreductase [Bacteroidota bacterium]
MPEFPEIVHRLKGKSILVTGGAGFIGSNLTKSLLELGAKVRVLDNLATGKEKNLEAFSSNEHFEFVEADIRNYESCLSCLDGIDAVSHQGALGSVPRSIAHPHQTHEVNASGFLNMLHACKESGVNRFVYASSSSVYGDSTTSPKVEGEEGNLLSPYAVTKQLNEKYASVYHQLHSMETIGLRYFNVFGPNQDPNGVYAAAIPKFIQAMMQGGSITINGDGSQTRDFTYVKNAVLANLLALTVEEKNAYGEAFNVACGDSFSLNELIAILKEELQALDKFNPSCEINHGPPREGDIPHSLANISKINQLLSYQAQYQFRDGIREYLTGIAK